MTAYEMRISDWSSDVCSSDLERVDVPDLDAIEGCGGVDGVQERAHPRGAPSAEGILQRLLSVGVAVVGEAGGLGHVDEEVEPVARDRHDGAALAVGDVGRPLVRRAEDRKSTRLNSSH